MTIKSFTFNPFMTNSYVIHDAGEAALVDAASHIRREHQAVLDYIETHDLTVRHLLLTHAHIDHIFGCAFFSERFGFDWQMHRADRFLIDRAREQAAAFGVTLDAPPAAEASLEEGDRIEVGGTVLDVLHTPGHSPGSVCFVDRQGTQALTGDVLFQDSIGRVEGLPKTSLPELLRSIEEKILPLGDDVAIYPGHGPATTIDRERRSNPFLTKDAFRMARGE